MAFQQVFQLYGVFLVDAFVQRAFSLALFFWEENLAVFPMDAVRGVFLVGRALQDHEVPYLFFQIWI